MELCAELQSCLVFAKLGSLQVDSAWEMHVCRWQNMPLCLQLTGLSRCSGLLSERNQDLGGIFLCVIIRFSVTAIVLHLCNGQMCQHLTPTVGAWTRKTPTKEEAEPTKNKSASDFKRI